MMRAVLKIVVLSSGVFLCSFGILNTITAADAFTPPAVFTRSSVTTRRQQEKPPRPFNDGFVTSLKRGPTTLTTSITTKSTKAINDDEAGVDVAQVLCEARVLNPSTGRYETAVQGLVGFPGTAAGLLQGDFWQFPKIMQNNNSRQKFLIVILPQLGDFDTWEYCEQLAACRDDLQRNNIALRVIGIGDAASAKRFARVAQFPVANLRVDPTGSLHRRLRLHGGPNWDIPSFIPKGILTWFKDFTGASKNSDDRLVARAWLNYMAMCAGIAAPHTLPEIIRGYLGDKSSPERLRPNDVVRVCDGQQDGDDEKDDDAMIVIRGTTDVKLGPIEYQSLWKNERGYLRPAELATVRLRGMVECLENFDEYVPDQTHVHLRGATFLFDGDKNLLYKHCDTGVLSYSKTMPRPLSFLEPFIGQKALNPLGLGDPIHA